MTEHPSDPQDQHPSPTMRDMLAGYMLFNAWEAQEQAQTLPHLGVQESLHQYFELCHLSSVLSNENDPVFLEQNARHWANLRGRLERLRTGQSHG